MTTETLRQIFHGDERSWLGSLEPRGALMVEMTLELSFEEETDKSGRGKGGIPGRRKIHTANVPPYFSPFPGCFLSHTPS
jgi:hypothetical protein